MIDREALKREKNLDDADLQAVVVRAAQLQQADRDARAQAIDVNEVASELDIAPAFVEAALAELEAEKARARARAASARRRRLAIMAAGAVAVVLLAGAVVARGKTIDHHRRRLTATETLLNDALARQAELVPSLMALSGADPRPLLEQARVVLQAPSPEARLAAAVELQEAITVALSRLPAPTDPSAEQRRLSVQHEIVGARNRIGVERARYEAVLRDVKTAESGLLGRVASASR